MLKALVLALACFGALSAAAMEAPRLGARFDRAITDGPLDMALFEAAARSYANAARRAHGQKPLREDDRLTQAAATHAGNMARLRTHSHRLPVAGEGRLVQRMARNGVRFGTAGENIGMEKVLRLLGRPIAASGRGCDFAYADTGAPVPVHTYASLAKSAIDRWMASPKHRASLLSPKFRRIGHGVAIDPRGPACGDVYLVQTFAD